MAMQIVVVRKSVAHETERVGSIPILPNNLLKIIAWRCQVKCPVKCPNGLGLVKDRCSLEVGFFVPFI